MSPASDVLSPAAPVREVGGKTVPGWFDGKATAAPTEAPDGLDASVKLVHERLDYLQQVLSIESSRVLLGGFGMGGALAITAGLAYRKRIAGIVSHSGWVCQPADELTQICNSHNAATAIMLIHGSENEHVTPEVAAVGAAALKAAGLSQVGSPPDP